MTVQSVNLWQFVNSSFFASAFAFFFTANCLLPLLTFSLPLPLPLPVFLLPLPDVQTHGRTSLPRGFEGLSHRVSRRQKCSILQHFLQSALIITKQETTVEDYPLFANYFWIFNIINHIRKVKNQHQT
jgi:hypothetical protein